MVRLKEIICLWVLIFVLDFYVNYGKTQENVEGTDCQTPDQISGKCILLTQCQPMLRVVRSLKRPFLPKLVEHLNAYKCELNGGSIKVCCPPGPVVLDTQNKIPIQNRTEPPDVTNHRNINLLPQTCGSLETELSWMALLQYKSAKGLNYSCSGTIIHKNYILTSAHCLSDLETGQQLVAVRVGAHSIQNETQDENKILKSNRPVQDLEIEEIIPHPEFGGRKGHLINDIGLVRVSTINLENENARPVCLPVGIVRDWPFKNVFVPKWTPDLRTGASSDILHSLNALPVMDKAECIKAYNDLGIPLTNTQICAGGKIGTDFCFRNSGGPMMVPALNEEGNLVYVQQGIESYGPKYCGITGYPGVYTLVKFYMDWILDTMKP